MSEESAESRLVEKLANIRRNEGDIYVREEINGRWQAVALATLPPDRWAVHVAGWLVRDGWPAREPEEARP